MISDVWILVAKFENKKESKKYIKQEYRDGDGLMEYEMQLIFI